MRFIFYNAHTYDISLILEVNNPDYIGRNFLINKKYPRRHKTLCTASCFYELEDRFFQ